MAMRVHWAAMSIMKMPSWSLGGSYEHWVSVGPHNRKQQLIESSTYLLFRDLMDTLSSFSCTCWTQYKNVTSIFNEELKCEFQYSLCVFFLGFTIAEGQLAVDPAKVQVVTDWSTLSSHSGLQFPVSWVLPTFCSVYIRGSASLHFQVLNFN